MYLLGTLTLSSLIATKCGGQEIPLQESKFNCQCQPQCTKHDPDNTTVVPGSSVSKIPSMVDANPCKHCS